MGCGDRGGGLKWSNGGIHHVHYLVIQKTSKQKPVSLLISAPSVQPSQRSSSSKQLHGIGYIESATSNTLIKTSPHAKQNSGVSISLARIT